MPFFNWMMNTVTGRCMTLIAGGFITISSVLFVKPDLVQWEPSHNRHGNVITPTQAKHFKDSRKVHVIMTPPIHPFSQGPPTAAMTVDFMANTVGEMESGSVPVTRTTESISTHQDSPKVSPMPAQPLETSPPSHDLFSSMSPRPQWVQQILDNLVYLIQTIIVLHRENILYWLLEVAVIIIGIQRRSYWDLQVIIEQLIWQINLQQLTIRSHKSDPRLELMTAMLTRKNVEIDTLTEHASVKDYARVSWIEYLERQAEARDGQNFSLRGEIYAQNGQIQTLTEAANARDRANSSLNRQIEAQNSRIQRMTADATTRETESTSLRETVATQNIQMESLRVAAETRNGEISELREENGGYRSQIQVMTETATAREAENASLREQNAAQTSRIQEMTEAGEGRDEELATQLSRVQAMIEAGKRRDEEIATLRQGVEVRDQNLEEARTRTASQQTGVDRLTTQNHTAATEASSLRETLEQSQNDLAESNDTIAKREEALDQLQDESFKLEDQMKRMKAQVEAGTAREEEQQQKMESVLSAVASSEDLVESLERSNGLLREQAAQADANASGIRAQMETQTETAERTRLNLVAQVDAEIAEFNVLEDDRDTWIEKYDELSEEVDRLRENHRGGHLGGQAPLENERPASTTAEETHSERQNVALEDESRAEERAVSSEQDSLSEKIHAENGKEPAQQSNNTNPLDANDSPDGLPIKQLEQKVEEIQRALVKGAGRNAVSTLFEELLTILSGKPGIQKDTQPTDDSNKGSVDDEDLLIDYTPSDEPVPEHFRDKIVETKRTLAEGGGIEALRPLLSELWAILDFSPAAKAETSHEEDQTQTSSLYEAFQPYELYTITEEPVESTHDDSPPKDDGRGNGYSRGEGEAQTMVECSDCGFHEGDSREGGSGENSDVGKAPSGEEDVHESNSSDPMSIPAEVLEEMTIENPALRSPVPSLPALSGTEPRKAHVSKTQSPRSESGSKQESDTGRSFPDSLSPRKMNPEAAEYIFEVSRALTRTPSTQGAAPSKISPSHLGLPGPGEKEGEPLTEGQVEALLFHQVIGPLQRTILASESNESPTSEEATKEALSPITISPGAQDKEDIKPSIPLKSDIGESSSSVKALSPPSGPDAATTTTLTTKADALDPLEETPIIAGEADASDPFEETPITAQEAEAAIFNVLQDVGTKSLSESMWAPGNEHMRPAATTPTPAPRRQQPQRPQQQQWHQQQRPKQWRQQQESRQHQYQNHQQHPHLRNQNQRRQPRESLATTESFARIQANIEKNTADNQRKEK